MTNKYIYETVNKFVRRVKQLLLGSSLVVLAACGSNSTSDNTVANPTGGAAINVVNTSDSKLLVSLAATYPNGQLPAALKAQADEALAQNPAALKMVANNTLIANAKPSFNKITAQAATTDTGSYSPVYRIQNTSLPGSYFFTIYDSERLNALQLNPRWKLEGAAFYTATGAAEGLSPVYRFRNKVNGSYVYTIYQSEYQSLLDNYSATFVLEGVSWYARQTPAPGYTPLYRFRNKTNGTYLFSAYEGEKDAIVANYAAIFELEGISYYVNITDTNPDCGEKLPEKTLATLPTSYSAKLLDNKFEGDKAFLTDTGYVAWRYSNCTAFPCGLIDGGFKLYNSNLDTTNTKYANIFAVRGSEQIVSLSDPGVLLTSENVFDPAAQNLDILTLPFAKLWDGITTTDSVVRAPVGLNSRAGRHTFSIPMGGVNDGSGRKWAYPNFPSYLDGAKLVNTSATLSLGNFPGAVNHCGTAVEGGGFTRDGLYFSRGTLFLNSVGEKFTADANLYPRISVSGLTNTKTTFGSLDNGFGATSGGLLGFIKTITAERYFPNIKVVDANNANTGVGYSVVATTSPPISYIPQEGQIMASDGAQALKPKVPSLALSGDNLIPKAINNTGQILVQTCTPSGFGGCLPPQKLYLLTPQ
jgi:hypothetical protein